MLGRSSTFFLFCAGLVTVYSCATGVNETEDDDGGPASSVSSSGGAATGSGGESSSEAASTVNSTTAMSSAASTSANTAASSSNVASSAQASSSSGGPCPLASPTNLMGCPSCAAACDSPWPASWSAVPGATHYIVEYTCITPNAFQTSNTSVDLCNEVGMCNNNFCAYGAGPVSVKACDSTCCSTPAQVPISETPIACGGGVCC